MARPEGRAEHRWLIELRESRLPFIRARPRIRRWIKRQLNRARRRTARQSGHGE